MRKILIAYYSWSGNTKKAAKKIKNETGGNLYEIKRKRPFKTSYKITALRALIEKLFGNLPALDQLPRIQDYDVVYLGFPIWWGRCPQIIVSFTKLTDNYAGLIRPFYTSGGSDAGKTDKLLKKLYPRAKVEKCRKIEIHTK